MAAMPSWWVWASGIMYCLSLVLNLILIVVVTMTAIKVIPLITDLKKKIDEVTGKVDSITTNVKSTVDTIHAKTTHILGSAEEASVEVTRKVSAASAAITAIFVVTRLVSALRGMQQQQQHAEPRHESRDGGKTARPTKLKLVRK